MTPYPYLFLNQSPSNCGAVAHAAAKLRRATGAHQQAQAQVPPQTRAVIVPLAQSAAQAITVLDAQFTWLCGPEKRLPPGRPQRDRNQLSVFADSSVLRTGRFMMETS